MVCTGIYRYESFLEAQPEHVLSSLRIQPHKEEAVGLLSGVFVQLQDGVLVVDATQLLTQGLDLLVVSQPPDAHAPHILPDYSADQVQALAGDEPGHPEVTTPRGQGHQPAAARGSTLPPLQDIAPVRHVVQDHTDLRGLHLPLPAPLRDLPLLIQDLAQSGLVHVLEHQGLLLLVRHLFEMFPERCILGVQLDGGREDPDPRELVLVVPQQQIQDDHRFAAGRGGTEEEAGGQVGEGCSMRAWNGFSCAWEDMNLVSSGLFTHFLIVGRNTLPLWFLTGALPGGGISESSLICS